jgi:hypothetical protein
MQPKDVSVSGSPGRFRLGQLIPALLALYLIPALLVVLLVGGVGMVVLAVARVITSIVRGPESWPHSPVGPESS